MVAADETSHIGVLGLTGCMIFALDINYLVDETQSAQMISARVSGNWIHDVCSKLTHWRTFGFAQPRFAESSYGKTDRAARNTFAARYAEQLLPLEVEVIDPPHAVHGNLAYAVDSIRISPQGAFSVRLAVNAASKAALNAVDVVHGYHSLASVIPAAVLHSVDQFVSFWNASIDDLKLVAPSRDDLMSAIHSYDIWDFDFHIVNAGVVRDVISVKSLYSQADHTPLQELTAISNMDIAHVESLQDFRLDQFMNSDIGERDDELWVIGRERTTRRHPERASTYNLAFFSDEKLATEMLLGYQCTLDFMEEWARRQRRALLDQILRYSDLSDLSKRDLQRRYSDVIRASQILVEPLALERGVRHSFFVKVICRLVDVLDLHNNTANSARAVSEFAELVKSVSAFHDAELSAKLGSIQVQLAKNAQEIGRLGIVLALVGIIVAAMQVYIALK